MIINYQKSFSDLMALFFLVIFPGIIYAQGLDSALGKAAGFHSPEKNDTQKSNTSELKIFSGQIGTYDEFIFYEKQCRTQIESSCIKAGQIMMSQTPPQRIFDLSLTTRTQRAISLYEVAISKGNLEAMEYAYDLYFVPNPFERALNSNADSVRANELLDQMLAKNYPGGIARQAQDFIMNPEYLLSIEKKSTACKNVKLLDGNSGMTSKTTEIINELNSSLVCKLLSR